MWGLAAFCACQAVLTRAHLLAATPLPQPMSMAYTGTPPWGPHPCDPLGLLSGRHTLIEKTGALICFHLETHSCCFSSTLVCALRVLGQPTLTSSRLDHRSSWRASFAHLRHPPPAAAGGRVDHHAHLLHHRRPYRALRVNGRRRRPPGADAAPKTARPRRCWMSHAFRWPVSSPAIAYTSDKFILRTISCPTDGSPDGHRLGYAHAQELGGLRSDSAPGIPDGEAAPVLVQRRTPPLFLSMSGLRVAETNGPRPDGAGDCRD